MKSALKEKVSDKQKKGAVCTDIAERMGLYQSLSLFKGKNRYGKTFYGLL